VFLTHWIGFLKSVTYPFWVKQRPALTNITALILETWQFSIRSTTVEGRWCRTPGSWRAASDYGSWLCLPCNPLRGL